LVVLLLFIDREAWGEETKQIPKNHHSPTARLLNRKVTTTNQTKPYQFLRCSSSVSTKENKDKQGLLHKYLILSNFLFLRTNRSESEIRLQHVKAKINLKIKFKGYRERYNSCRQPLRSTGIKKMPVLIVIFISTSNSLLSLDRDNNLLLKEMESLCLTVLSDRLLGTLSNFKKWTS
jgi:hypothetical protein